MHTCFLSSDKFGMLQLSSMYSLIPLISRQNPPKFLPGVSQDVTDYSIAVGMIDPMIIPASIACPTSTCNYSVQSLSDFTSLLSASVSAINIIGRGELEVCTPQKEIGVKECINSSYMHNNYTTLYYKNNLSRINFVFYVWQLQT